MWKILIADDEPKIRRGLRALIERMDEVEVVGEAEDGEVALELAANLRPDILFIDIRMPFLGGLDLIGRLNALGRDWIVVIVTGHDEIEYAQQAVRLKVFDYLLKPVENDVLDAVIGKAKTELSLRRASDRYTAWARDQLERNVPALRERFLRSLISGSLSRSEIEESARFLGLSIEGGSTMVLVRLSDKAALLSGMREEYRRLMILAIRSIAEAAIKTQVPPLLFDDDADGLVAIVAFRSEQEAAETISLIESEIESSVHQVPFIVHEAASDIHALPGLYEDLSERLNEKGNYRTFVLMAQSYIEKHYRESDLSLEKVASELELSSGYLSRLMKLETGLGFVDWLTRFRVQKAARLMNDPAVKVFEAAEKVGYHDQHYFSRAFKRVLGVSPVEYRRGGQS